ncbi:MAG: biotin--[acetyl-CoA-carboxylase] ligase [Planctomycetes bacterium]|nr:biotin--[acetyl-CoA-carboxylase] ligase [Planctomycetota bacterium]
MNTNDFKRLEEGLEGFAFHVYEELDSTNTKAFELIEAGAGHFSVVVAMAQTKGRGRFDRRWISEPGMDLAFSVIVKLRSDDDARFLPHYSGVSVMQALESIETCAGIGLRWPNDVVASDRKLGGFLIETRSNVRRFAVVGVGLNVLGTAERFPKDLETPAGTIEESLKADPRELRERVLGGVARALSANYDLLLENKPRLFDEYKKRLLYLGEQVDVQMTNGFTKMRFIDVDPDRGVKLQLVDNDPEWFQPASILRLLKKNND